MVDLTEDLLYLAQAAEGRPSSRQFVDLNELVLSEGERLRQTSDLYITVDVMQPRRCYGGERDLARALRNVTENARTHASSQIALSIDGDDTDGVITVTDDGHGISADQRAQIFQRFVRLDPVRRRQSSSGFGLGLAIAREIIRGNGGTLSVHDRDDGKPGAAFEIRLPRSDATSVL